MTHPTKPAQLYFVAGSIPFSPTNPSSFLEKMYQNLLGKWLSAISKKLRAIGKGRPKRLATNFNWLSSSCAGMEIPNQLKQVFKVMDSNGDGKISPVELGEVLLCLGHEKSTAAQEAEGMVREADCNGDGFIDLEEFMQAVGGKAEGWSCSSNEDLMEAFLVFDTDRNGFISAEELQRVLVGLGHGKCSLEECWHMIKGVDRNGDGLVDFEEFRSMMTSSHAF